LYAIKAGTVYNLGDKAGYNLLSHNQFLILQRCPRLKFSYNQP